MGVVVQFNYPDWISLFPQFRYVTPAQAQMYFSTATGFCRNDGGGPVEDAQTQTDILNFLTAHIAQLLSTQQAGGAPPNTNSPPSASVVGRVSNASEGSVSAAFENNYPAGTPQWYQQTSYGSIAYARMLPFRTMRYRPPRHRRVFNPFTWGQWGGRW